ncbi:MULTISPECIES: GNAT family N-acetyltransferase [unclassified Janibacter]|uniref:GNAT family N-acetyltransferase n=1 Tax=unclassified Janibacter TaxID=2649294 RepID=UPI003CFC6F4E
MPALRPLTLDDVPALTAQLVANREHLAPWEPLREDSWFEEDFQRDEVRTVLSEVEAGRMAAFAITDENGDLVGRLNLNGIVRGAFQSAALGYWVSASHTRRGLATAAVEEVAAIAFGPLGLHRIQAETLLANGTSRRVLERNGFVRYGLAPEYLRIAGRWQDVELFQRLAPDA